MWRVEDGKQIATVTVEADFVQYLAVSKDGRWIAAGTLHGEVIVWDAKTYEKVILHKEDRYRNHVNGVDFSPDSSRLVSASHKGTASIWDIATRKRVQKLNHGDWLTVAKYSPQGDRIATSSYRSVRVWDSNDGRVLVDLPEGVGTWEDGRILWFNNHLFVVSNRKIKQFEASTGSAVSEWPVPGSDHSPCIVLPKHGGFIVCSTSRSVTFWDTATHTQLRVLEYPQVYTIAVSPDDRFLAIVEEGKITINSLSCIAVRILFRCIGVHMILGWFFNAIHSLSPVHTTFQEPNIRIDDAALHSWKHNQLANAEALLTAAIHKSHNPSHHALANRALVRARLRQCDAAIADATEVFLTLLSHALSLIYIKSIKIKPSVIGYIAKSVALVGNGKKYKAYRACDIAFKRCHSTHVTFLLLIKVCPMHSSLVAFRSSHCLGYRRVYGRRAWRRDTPRRRPHRCGYDPLQLNMLCGSGTYITRYHTVNITTHIYTRRICIFSLETRAWRVVITRVQHNPSSVHEPKCYPTRVQRSRWSHW